MNLLIFNEQHCWPRRDNGWRYDNYNNGQRCDYEDSNDNCRRCNDEDDDDNGRRRYNDNDNSWRCGDDDDYNNGWRRYNNDNDGLRWDDVGGVMTRLTMTNLHFTINLKTKWLHGKHVSHPQNHRQATTNTAMELLPLGNVVTCCAIVGVNLDNTGAETIVTVRPSSKMLGQIPNLTPLNTILDDKNFQQSSSFSLRHAN